MRKPVSIWQFERVLALATVLETANNLVTAPQAKRLLSDLGPMSEIAWGAFVGLLLSGFGFSLLIWYFIVRRASNAARIFYSFLAGLGIQGLYTKLVNYEIVPWYTQAIFIMSLCLHLYGAWLLWRPDSRIWFARGIGDVPVPLRHLEQHLGG